MRYGERLSGLFFWGPARIDLPRVLDMPLEVYLGRGLPGRLDCVVDANPPVSQVVWTRNERPMDVDWSSSSPRVLVVVDWSSSSPRVLVDDGGSLVFRVVSAVDEARYACAAYSSLGAGRSSTTVRVYVRGRHFALFHDLLLRSRLKTYLFHKSFPHRLPSSIRTDSTDFTAGPFLLSISVLCF